MNNFDTVREALAAAQNGLKWYREMHPEDDSGADDEMMAEIEEALTALAQIEADHFTSHDMASAAAQGHRDGVASVQGEPVKWMCTETKVLYDHDTSEVDKYHGFKPTVPLYAAAPVAQQPQANSLESGGIKTVESHQIKTVEIDGIKTAQQPQAEAVPCDVEVVRKALDRAFTMGQNYWADADSESIRANKRSDVTRAKFLEMREEVCAAFAAQGAKV